MTAPEHNPAACAEPGCARMRAGASTHCLRHQRAEPAPEHNPAAWAVAVALAGDADWARWTRGETALVCTCGEWGDGARLVRTSCPHHGTDPPVHGRSAFRDGPPRQTATPVPAPWDADAYRADCARRGVEPGPMPSLEYAGSDGFGWKVDRSGVGVYVEFAWDGGHVATWVAMLDCIVWEGGDPETPREVVGRIFAGATAAAKAMAQP